MYERSYMRWEIVDKWSVDGVKFTLYRRGGTPEIPVDYKWSREEGRYYHEDYLGEMSEKQAIWEVEKMVRN